MAYPSKRLQAIMDDNEKPKTYRGKSMKLGHGGRAAKLRDQLSKKGFPKKEIGGIIGNIARAKGAARGQRNYHGK